MQVYSHNTDKLVDREVAFSRGTGGATLLLHCVLDPTLAEAIATTYFFLDWRNFQPVSAMLLNQHDLLPEEAELDEVGRVLLAVLSAVLWMVVSWGTGGQQDPVFYSTQPVVGCSHTPLQ